MKEFERYTSSFVQTISEMDAEWIEKARKIHPMFWWKLQRLMVLKEGAEILLEERV